MLVLKRKLNESLVIDVNGVIVRVKVVYRRPDGVGIGVDAPRDVRVDREEIYEIRQEVTRANTH